MIPRLMLKSKDFFIFFVTLILALGVFYFYLLNLQEKRSVLSSGERCISELSSLKYQLNEVTEYKNHIDKLLTETQRAYESNKEKFKDIMESCVAMKQQSAICQSQFEDLQSECKKAKDELNKLKKSNNA